MSMHAYLRNRTPETLERNCGVCGERVPYQGRGQPRKYCPGECRAVAARQQQRDKWKRHGDRYNAKRRKQREDTRGQRQRTPSLRDSRQPQVG